MLELLTFVLAWMLLGSIGVNIIWAQVVYRKQVHNRVKPWHFAKGILLGLIMGPISMAAAIVKDRK